MTDEIKYFIIHVVLDNPGIMLHEIQNEILTTFNTRIAESTICQILHKLQFSRKKMCIVATQQDEMLCALFVSEVSFYKANMFVFLDETGTDRRDVICKYAYGWRGKPIVAQKLLVRGQHLSTIAFMSTAGLLDCATITGGVNGDVFYEFVHSKLLYHSMDLIPIEELFSKVKKKIKWYKSDLHSNEMDLQTVVQTSFCHVTPEDCYGWIASTGMYHMDQD